LKYAYVKAFTNVNGQNNIRLSTNMPTYSQYNTNNTQTPQVGNMTSTIPPAPVLTFQQPMQNTTLSNTNINTNPTNTNLYNKPTLDSNIQSINFHQIKPQPQPSPIIGQINSMNTGVVTNNIGIIQPITVNTGQLMYQNTSSISNNTQKQLKLKMSIFG